jgi:intein/homing endonuclease
MNMDFLPEITKIDNKIHFSCDCVVEHQDYAPVIDFDNINLGCPNTYELLSEGYTGNIFQLDSPVSHTLTKNLKPTSMEDIANLVSISRPGCLSAKFPSDGKSMSSHIIMRKHKEEEVTYIHPSLEPILKPTEGCIVFQEQAIRIAKDIAGFTESEGDTLRKCVTGDTYFVSNTRGYISIDTLLETGYSNDLFLTTNEFGKHEWKKIRHIWYTGLKTVDKIQSRTGFNIKATKNHQFLTDTGWKSRQRLKIGEDYLIGVKNVDFTGIDEYPLSVYMIIAGLLTEGYCPEIASAKFTNHDPYMHKVFSDACIDYFGRIPTLTSSTYDTLLNKKESDFLRNIMKFGLSATKEIPEFMMRATLETTREFLSFMFAGECSMTTARADIEYSSASEKMIDQIKLLLLRFGIISNKLKSFNTEYQRFYYKLYICDRDGKLSFKNNLTKHITQYKIDNLDRELKKDKNSLSLLDAFPRTVVDKLLNQFPGVAHGHGTVNEGGSLFSAETILRDRFTRLAARSKNKLWIEMSKGLQVFDKLESIEYFGKQIKVYDFSMEDEDCPYIVANGLVIHNSIGKKDVKLMAKLKDTFLEGCKKTGIVDEDIAKQLFENIEKSQKYSFNKCISSSTLLIFDDNSRDDLGSLYRSGSWKNRKSLSLKILPRLIHTQREKHHITDTLVKNTEVIPNEIIDIRDAGQQLVYRITLKRRKVRDKRYPKVARPHYSIDVTANHKFPTRCHGELKASELIPGVHSLYCYDYNRGYQPKYRHAASRVISIEKLGVQQVYDVEMKAPHHNFLANDIFTCNSHAVGYGKQSYITAWVKTHFPIEFYAANLRLNEERGGKKDKLLDEKAGTIREAKEFGISIIPPRMDFAVSEFDIKDNSTISYGLSNIKGTGLKEAELTIEFLKDKKPTWLEILFGLGSTIKSNSFENICGTGFFLGVGGTRNSQIYEYRTYKKFTDKEESWIRDRLSEFKSLEEAIVALLSNFTDTSVKPRERGIARKDRVSKVEDFLKTLREPPHSLEDTPLTINKSEKDLLGVALTYSDVEARSLCGIFTDTTCKEFNDGKRAKSMTMAVSLGRIKEHICKGDKTMCFCSCSDPTAMIESVIAFADVYEAYENTLTEKNTVILQGVRGDKNTFIINKVVQI